MRRLPASLTARPLTAVMTSPALIPAFSAADPSTTCDTSAPCTLFARSMLSAISGVSVWMLTPSTPRFTSPYLMSWFITIFIMLDGIAKPMPMLPPVRDRIAELMPTSSPVEVDQRAARVARVDRRVGLDEVLVALRVDARAPERADDAGGDGVAEAEWIADRDDEIADFGAIAVRDLDVHEVRCLHLEHSHVGARILADHLGGERAVVEQLHRDLRGVLDHVRIGDDVAVLRVDDDARARALEFTLPRRVRHVEEAAEEGVVQQRVLLLHRAASRDVHDGGGDALQHRRQRRYRGFADGRRQLRAGDRHPRGEQAGGEAQMKLHKQ